MALHTTIESITHPLLNRLAANWWLLLLRGILALVFAVAIIAWPGSALLALVLIYGVYAFCDGAIVLWAAYADTEDDAPVWWLVTVGVAGMVAGIGALAWPEVSAILFVLIVAAWAIVSGVVQIMGAIELRKEMRHEWQLLASGVVSL